MPRWEIWMGVFIHYSIANVVNSLAAFEIATVSAGGIMESQTRAAADKVLGNVMLLESHIMNLWREKDSEFEKAQEDFHEFLEEADQASVLRKIEQGAGFYHEIIELLRRRGFLRFKPPRSFGHKHDE